MWVNGRFFICCSITGLIVTAELEPVVAQDAIDVAVLERCASISSDTARLACYDAVAQVALDALAAPASTARAPEAEPPTDRSPDDEAAGIAAFGVEQVGDRGFEIPGEIQSRLIGEFTGWRGNTVFRLENGQVWRQAERDRLVFRADAPLVTIRRGAFGTYRLSVEGLNSSVRVRRVQ